MLYTPCTPLYIIIVDNSWHSCCQDYILLWNLFQEREFHCAVMKTACHSTKLKVCGHMMQDSLVCCYYGFKNLVQLYVKGEVPCICKLQPYNWLKTFHLAFGSGFFLCKIHCIRCTYYVETYNCSCVWNIIMCRVFTFFSFVPVMVKLWSHNSLHNSCVG